MGQEFGQEREWSEERELDWNLIGENKLNAGMQKYVKELLNLYKTNPAMYEMDNELDGFEWINADDSYHGVYTFIRKSKDGKRNLLFVCNFTPVEWKEYRVGVPKKKKYKLLFSSDEKKFGGNRLITTDSVSATAKEWDNRDYSIACPLKPYEAIVFSF